MKMPDPAYVLAATLPLAAACWWFVSDLRAQSRLPSQPSDLKSQAYVASDRCVTCHPQQHASWQKTFHRSMTRPATPENVKAPIGDEVVLSFYGQTVRITRTGDRYSATLPRGPGDVVTYPIKYTIGSRRMQQFAVQDGSRIFRLPVFYSLQDQQWMHINSAFFRRKSDNPDDFFKGYSIWNPNCIFCHNTRPNPGMDYPNYSFNSEVGELGIACEECHAPGALHSELNRNPLRRYRFHLSNNVDPSITNPEKLDQLKATQVCGQCHGQRIPEPRSRIGDLMRHGDPFVPGDDLSFYYAPMQKDTKLPDVNIEVRFWKDGAPRLTAYEYQGLTASACFEDPRMTCTSCHNMHGGDPKGMIDPEMRTNKACTGCHPELEEPQAAEAHAGHPLKAASCYDCHMPKVVYGVQSLHPTHLIRNPDPSRTVDYGMPNACNLCHLDKSVDWAIEAFNNTWQRQLPTAGTPFDLPELVRGFAQGDAVYRTMVLEHSEFQELPSEALEGVLLAAMEDPYYIVTHFGERALKVRFPNDQVEDWAAFLRQRGAELPPEIEELRVDGGYDVPVEFGE